MIDNNLYYQTHYNYLYAAQPKIDLELVGYLQSLYPGRAINFMGEGYSIYSDKGYMFFTTQQLRREMNLKKLGIWEKTLKFIL